VDHHIKKWSKNLVFLHIKQELVVENFAAKISAARSFAIFVLLMLIRWCGEKLLNCMTSIVSVLLENQVGEDEISWNLTVIPRVYSTCFSYYNSLTTTICVNWNGPVLTQKYCKRFTCRFCASVH